MQKLIAKFPPLTVLAAHVSFITGFSLLLIYSLGANEPIQLQQIQLYKVLLYFVAGYGFVAARWIDVINNNDLYGGHADDVPQYLTWRLYGYFPYLFTFGKSNSHNNRKRIGRLWHTYQDNDVKNKKFSEIFCLHVNKSSLIVLLLTAVLLPNLISSQIAPSFLGFIFSSFVLYSLYMAFLMLIWLSAVALFLLRVWLFLKNKLSI